MTAVAALVAVGGGAGLGLIAVPHVGAFLGMLVGGFLLGALAGTRPLLEGAVAAVTAQLAILAAAGVPGAGLTGAAAALGAITPATLTLSLALSAVVGGFGVHLGDDLRHGLVTPLEDESSSETVSESSAEAETNSHAGADVDDTSSIDPEAERELIHESVDE
ncbi:MAG: hypothetical protein PPP55_06980 [Halorubrum sp.]